MNQTLYRAVHHRLYTLAFYLLASKDLNNIMSLVGYSRYTRFS
jgi:hypothetical protein